MNNFDYIINPTTGRKVKINSQLGQKIIKNYALVKKEASPIKNTNSMVNHKKDKELDNLITTNPQLSRFKDIIETSFSIAVDEILNNTQRILTEEQYISLATIHYNILNLDNKDILEQFRLLDINQKDSSNNNVSLLVMKCLGMQHDDILSIMPKEQRGGWYGCVEPGLTHEQIQQKTSIQKRRMCQRDTGLPVGRFANNQSCVQAVMHDPTLCNPPPTIGERVRHSAAYAAGRVGQYANVASQNIESHGATSLIGFLSFLNLIPELGLQSSIIFGVLVVIISVLTGITSHLDESMENFFREYRVARERVRQADERDRRRREREERERREHQRQMDRLRREARERQQRWEEERHREWTRTNQQRLEQLARIERKRIATERMRKAIRKVLSAGKFVRETQVSIGDKLRSDNETNFVSLIGYRVHVIGKGFGTIIDYDLSKKKDIISYDIRHGNQLVIPLVKPIVLGTARTYRKHLRQRVGKAFRIISDINSQLVPWPLPRTAVAENSNDEDVPMARALSETSATRQLIAPTGLMVNTRLLDHESYFNADVARIISDR